MGHVLVVNNALQVQLVKQQELFLAQRQLWRGSLVQLALSAGDVEVAQVTVARAIDESLRLDALGGQVFLAARRLKLHLARTLHRRRPAAGEDQSIPARRPV